MIEKKKKKNRAEEYRRSMSTKKSFIFSQRVGHDASFIGYKSYLKRNKNVHAVELFCSIFNLHSKKLTQPLVENEPQYQSL